MRSEAQGSYVRHTQLRCEITSRYANKFPVLFLAGFFALLKQLKQYRYASSLRSCWRWRRRYRPPGNAQRYSKHAVAKRKQSSDIPI
jgi:hypothetical protein